jgi:hypothetical protein
MFALATKENSTDPIIERQRGDYSLAFPLAAARVVSTQLLDGGTYHHDGGFADKDRTGQLIFETDDVSLERITDKWLRNRTALRLSTEEGVFDVTLTNSTSAKGIITISFRVDLVAGLTADILYPTDDTPSPWAEKTSDTYWASGGTDTLTWDGSKWSGTSVGAGFTSYQFILYDVPAWVVGYRPTKFRITFSLTGSYNNFFKLASAAPFSMLEFLPGEPVSTQSYDISVDPSDLNSIQFYGNHTGGLTIEISKIEFYVEP